MTIAVRLLTKIRAESPEACWVWTGARNRGGYGVLRVGGVSTELAHRLAFEWFHGPIPVGMQIDHLCRNRACVNPEHLEAVAPGENSRRGVSFNGSKTHCPQGHEYTPENTRRDTKGRHCRRCQAEHKRAYKRRRRERSAA